MAWNGRPRQAEREYRHPVTTRPAQVMAELITFLGSFCKAIGRSEFIDPGVGSLGQPVREIAAE
jgi:hypothetical protein